MDGLADAVLRLAAQQLGRRGVEGADEVVLVHGDDALKHMVDDAAEDHGVLPLDLGYVGAALGLCDGQEHRFHGGIDEPGGNIALLAVVAGIVAGKDQLAPVGDRALHPVDQVAYVDAGGRVGLYGDGQVVLQEIHAAYGVDRSHHADGQFAAAFNRPADGEEHVAAGDGYFHHRGQNIAFFQAGRGAAARDDDVSIVMAREDNLGRKLTVHGIGKVMALPEDFLMQRPGFVYNVYQCRGWNNKGDIRHRQYPPIPVHYIRHPLPFQVETFYCYLKYTQRGPAASADHPAGPEADRVSGVSCYQKTPAGFRQESSDQVSQPLNTGC